MPNQPTIRFDIPRTYRTPGTPRRTAPRFIGSTGTSGAFAFAEGLSRLNPQIQQFLGTGFDLYQENERARADEFSRNYKGTYADAVRKGDLPAGASPFFREQVLRNEVQTKGRHFNAWLQSRWREDESIKGADEDSFETWLEGQTSEYANSELNQYSSRLVSEEFDPYSRQAQSNLAAHHIADGFRRTKQRGLDALQDGILSVVREVQTTSDIMPIAQRYVAAGGSLEGKTDAEIRRDYVTQFIDQKITEANNVGISYGDSNKLVSDALGFLALESGDAAILEIGDHIKAGTGPLSGTMAYREMALDVSHKIAVQEEAAARKNEAVMKAQEKARKDRLRLDMWRLGVEDPDQLLQIALNYGGDDPEELEIVTDTLNALDIEPKAGTEHTAQLVDITSNARLGRYEVEEITSIQKRMGLTVSETDTLLRLNEQGRKTIERNVQSQVDEIVEQLESAAKVENAGYGIGAQQALVIRREKQRIQDEIADLYQQHDGNPPRERIYAIQDQALQRGLSGISGSQQITALTEQEQPVIEQSAPEAYPTVETQPIPQVSTVRSPSGKSAQVPVAAIEALRQNANDPAVIQQFNEKYFGGEPVAETLIQ